MRAPQTLGARIAQARREMAVREHRDVTAAEVAKAVGVTNTSMSEWESDKKSPREDALAKLAAYLGVTPAYLRYGVTSGAAALHAAESALDQRTAEPSIRDRLTKDPERSVAAHLETLKAKRPAAKRANGRRRRGGLDSA